jgi:hypothetical protein
MPAYPSMKTVFFTDRIITQVRRDVVDPFLDLVGVEFTNDLKRSMKNSPKTGRVYRRGRKTHRASAPGEPPAVDTGDLVKSIRWQRRNHGDLHVVEIGSTKKKSLYLEMGAAKLSRPPARVRRRRRQTGREARWILFPRPAWGPTGRRITARLPELLRRARRMRRKS